MHQDAQHGLGLRRAGGRPARRRDDHRDVGAVGLGGTSYEISAVNLEGNPAVSMAISQLGGSNALVVSDGVKQVIEEFKEKMPVGMKIEQVFDSTEFITASIEGVVGSLRDAVVLVVLILFLFL